MTRNAYYEEVYRARESGRFAELYESLVVDDAAVERGLARWLSSRRSTLRLRDALRGILLGQEFEFPRPNVVDDAAYAVDVMALGEADVVRLQRQLDTLDERLRRDRAPPGGARRTASSAG